MLSTCVCPGPVLCRWGTGPPVSFVAKEGLHHVTPVVPSLPRPPHKDTAIGSHPPASGQGPVPVTAEVPSRKGGSLLWLSSWVCDFVSVTENRLWPVYCLQLIVVLCTRACCTCSQHTCFQEHLGSFEMRRVCQWGKLHRKPVSLRSHLSPPRPRVQMPLCFLTG